MLELALKNFRYILLHKGYTYNERMDEKEVNDFMVGRCLIGNLYISIE